MAFAKEMNFRSYSTLYRYTLRWTIDGISKLPETWTEKCPEFIVEPESRWHVEFKKEEGAFFLYLCSKNEKNFKKSYEIIVSNSNKKVLCSDEEKWDEDDELDVMPSDFNEKTIESLPNDQVIFTISIKVWYFQSDASQLWKTPEIQQDHLLKLQGDFKNIYTNNIKPDVTLHVKDESLTAHKAVLMARSDVFARMFQSGLKEDETGTVDIEDIKLSAMEVLLLFMYSAEIVDMDLDTARDVYAAADKYAIEDLKDVCRRIMASKVTVDSAAKILVFADARDDPILRKSMMEYIALHYSADKEKE